jgi:hypothetical protein
MAKLIYHSSASKDKDDLLKNNPELIGAIERLEYQMEKHPERGVPKKVKIDATRCVSCRRLSICTNLYSDWDVFGNRQLSALYIYHNSTLRTHFINKKQ